MVDLIVSRTAGFTRAHAQPTNMPQPSVVVAVPAARRKLGGMLQMKWFHRQRCQRASNVPASSCVTKPSRTWSVGHAGLCGVRNRCARANPVRRASSVSVGFFNDGVGTVFCQTRVPCRARAMGCTSCSGRTLTGRRLAGVSRRAMYNSQVTWCVIKATVSAKKTATRAHAHHDRKTRHPRSIAVTRRTWQGRDVYRSTRTRLYLYLKQV